MFTDDDVLSECLKGEVNAFLAGIYGICTINGTPDEIIRKEIAVKKLLDFQEQTQARLSETEIGELEHLVEEYDSVAALFAPYQRAASSRGKYVDAPLRRAGLEALIKDY